MMIYPSCSEFKSLAQTGNLIPVYAEILADMETPVSAFKKIDDGQLSFLLESIEGEKNGRVILFLVQVPGWYFDHKGISTKLSVMAPLRLVLNVVTRLRSLSSCCLSINRSKCLGCHAFAAERLAI